MKKSLSEIQYSRLETLYAKLSKRLDKQFKTGRFSALTKVKQVKLLQRIERIKLQLQRLNLGLKLSSTALALGTLLYSSNVQAQFTAGTEFRVNTFTNTDQLRPSVAIDGEGDFVVTWESYGQEESYNGIYGQLYSASGVAQGVEFRVNTYTTDLQKRPSVAMDSDGDFVVTWESRFQDGSGYGIYGQRYNASGVAQGLEFQVNTYTTNNQRNPSIAVDSDGDFVVIWDSFDQDGSNYGIYGQRYNASGVAQGPEFKVNTYTTNNQRNPSIAIDSDGDFMVTWESFGQDGSNYGIYGQRFNALGVAQGVEFLVNTTTANIQRFSSVAMDYDGDFVVTWQHSYDGSNFGIYGQRFSASGVEQGIEFLVNTYTSNNQELSSLAMDSDGDFVVTWQSGSQDGSEYGIYSQRYNASGVAQGLEFLVNTATTYSQRYTSVAMDSDGDFVVTWQSRFQDGSDYGIYAQRYVNNNAPFIIAQSFSIAENSANGTAVGTVIASDADAGQTISYAITAGNTGSVFAINSSTGDITVNGPLDFETTTSYALTVEVSDNGTPVKSASATITINITDVNEVTSVTAGSQLAALALYPNPARERVFVNLEGEVSVRVLDLSGAVIKVTALDNQSFSIADLKAGLYLIELNKDGAIATKKLVVE